MKTLELKDGIAEFKKELQAFEDSEETKEESISGFVRGIYIMLEKHRLPLFEQKLSEQKSIIANTYFKTDKVL